MSDSSTNISDALLLMGRHCPYCPAVLKALQALQRDGLIGTLDTLFIEDHPEQAAALGVRSVPWLRLGPFELSGLRSESELREWVVKAGTVQGTAQYLKELLMTGKIASVLKLTHDRAGIMQALLFLFSSPDTDLNTRIGISAVMESLVGSGKIDEIITHLCELTRHQQPGIRGDACYYLALSGNKNVIPCIEILINDTDASVREIATESLQQLHTASPHS
jgi:Thioredoxin domain/HEAT repeat